MKQNSKKKTLVPPTQLKMIVTVLRMLLWWSNFIIMVVMAAVNQGTRHQSFSQEIILTLRACLCRTPQNYSYIKGQKIHWVCVTFWLCDTDTVRLYRTVPLACHVITGTAGSRLHCNNTGRGSLGTQQANTHCSPERLQTAAQSSGVSFNHFISSPGFYCNQMSSTCITL